MSPSNHPQIPNAMCPNSGSPFAHHTWLPSHMFLNVFHPQMPWVQGFFLLHVVSSLLHLTIFRIFLPPGSFIRTGHTATLWPFALLLPFVVPQICLKGPFPFAIVHWPNKPKVRHQKPVKMNPSCVSCPLLSLFPSFLLLNNASPALWLAFRGLVCPTLASPGLECYFSPSYKNFSPFSLWLPVLRHHPPCNVLEKLFWQSFPLPFPSSSHLSSPFFFLLDSRILQDAAWFLFRVRP